MLLVTSVETAAILDAYASIKLLGDAKRPPSIDLLVNRAPREVLAREAHERLAQACRRFLGLSLRSAGHVPEDGAVPQAAARGEPFVLAMQAAPASLHLRQVLENLRMPAARAHVRMVVEQRGGVRKRIVPSRKTRRKQRLNLGLGASDKEGQALLVDALSNFSGQVKFDGSPETHAWLVNMLGFSASWH